MTSLESKSLIKKERKSRRTHKNSRDGCPNCKSKRIKCSEDLPSCQNCIKKEYRCGYLDFPPERVEQIRLKNERKRQGRAIHDDMQPPEQALSQVASETGDVPLTSPPTNQFFVNKDSLRYQLYRDSFLRVADDATQFVHAPTEDELEGSKASFFPKDFHPRRHSVDSRFDYHTVSPAGRQPLPEAHFSGRLFRLLVREKRLKNTFILNLYKKCGGDLKRMINDKFDYEYLPVWNATLCSAFWASIYNQLVILDVYYSFFVDRSLNILLKACNDHLTIGADCVSSSSNSPYNDSPTSSVGSPDACYNYEDLAVLTRQSFQIYGQLIRNLRESLSRIHFEYLAKISLFAGWSSFLHVRASMQTVSMIYSGTASLVSKICHDAQSVSDITPTIRVVLDIVNLHLSFCLVPDYRYSVMHEILADLEEFLQAFGDTSPGGDPICDKASMFRLTSLHGFLKKVVTSCFPNIQSLNHAANIRYLRPSSLCELIVYWFRIFPSELVSLGSRAPYMTKMVCLFYMATGKALENVLTCIRLVWMIDMCNIICSRSDFNPMLFALDAPSSLTQAQITVLTRVQMRLIRIGTFFSYRSLFFSHLLSTTTVLNQNFTRIALPGVLELVPAKLEIDEIMVPLFGVDLVIEYENFPRLPFFGYDQGYQEVVQRSQMMQSSTLAEPPRVNFLLGLSVYDFDPRELLQRFAARQEKAWQLSGTSIEEWRNRMNCVEACRREIAACTEN